MRHWTSLQEGRFILAATIAVAAGLFTTAEVAAQPPAGYYDTAHGKTGTQLRSALHSIIRGHTRVTYATVWTVLESADRNPNNTSHILDVYRNRSHAFTDRYSSTIPGGWAREHSWPSSYGFTNDGSCNYPYTDVHHLFAVNQSYNSSRGNKPFALCPGCTSYPVDSLSLANYSNSSTWEVWENRKGDIARAMFYMDVRYEGGFHKTQTNCAEPDLILTNNRSLIVSNTQTNLSTAYMGELSQLLSWHLADPVDDRERHRNNVIFSYQNNRNPFIDHPAFVCALYGITGCTQTFTATFQSVAAEDGYILETTATSSQGGSDGSSATGTTLRVGDDANRRCFRSVLSFDTSTIPSTATITKATLRLTRTSVVGTPTSGLGTLTADLARPLGATNAFEFADWQGSVAVSSAANFALPTVNGGQTSSDLNSTALGQINKSGRTQFRLRFNTQDNGNTTADYINFASREHGTASYRPVLVVEYTN